MLIDPPTTTEHPLVWKRKLTARLFLRLWRLIRRAAACNLFTTSRINVHLAIGSLSGTVLLLAHANTIFFTHLSLQF